MTSPLPSRAEIVIIGGGIVGCSTAYHLAAEGTRDVVLLDRSTLTSGSTFHAAGLVGQLRSSANITRLLQYSVRLYSTLEETTGQATGWKQNGGLRLACSQERMIELQRSATTARSFGLEVDLISPREAAELWPPMVVSDLVGAAFLPGDGQANPSDITQALARGARSGGVKVFENVNVIGIGTEAGRVTSVETNRGPVECEKVINCGGQWARQIGALAGVNVPLVSIAHQYIISEKLPGVHGTLPTLRDPDRLVYFKEEVGGLVMGGYEANPKSCFEDGIPIDFNNRLLGEDWEHFEPLMAQAVARVPSLETTGIRKLINGPESFTPDGNFILGEAPEVAGFYVGAGFNAFGIAAGGGAGKALAEWVLADEQPVDLWPVDIRRFGDVHRDTDWVRSRSHELYAKHYTISWPHEEHSTARRSKISPLYQTLADQGACFGSKLGWERPNWFADGGQETTDIYSFGHQNWFDAVGKEHQACRDGVVIFDQSSFAKFSLEGPDALGALERICSNRIDRSPGSVVYTQMLNDRAGIEADLTVTRQTEESFYIVTGTGFRTRDAHWIRRSLTSGSKVTLSDLTEQRAVLSLMGPRSRDLLSQVTDSDVTNESFPFATMRSIRIAGHPVMAIRLTYVGELGWELHTDRGHALDVYRSLMATGADLSIANAGYRAIESLRLEKGYRAWGSDIGPDHTPHEAGLGWAVKLGSDLDFVGREAAERQAEYGVDKMMACFTVDDPDVTLLGRESIYRNGVIIGWLTSGGWGYTVKSNIGYGYVENIGGIVDQNYLIDGEYELEVAEVRHQCAIHLLPLYDPHMGRVKC